MKTQMFFGGLKLDFYLERYERTADLWVNGHLWC
jgi:hypothetical protein